MHLLNCTRGVVLADEVSFAYTFLARFFGFMGRRVPERRALVLSPCRAVHTWFVLEPLDVVFLDSDWRVVRTVEELRPFKFSPIVPDAVLAVEMAAGKIRASGTQAGDLLEVVS